MSLSLLLAAITHAQLLLRPEAAAVGSTMNYSTLVPNVWGGLSARPKGDSGNLFAFSGLDGTTVESSLAFVAVFAPREYSLLFGTATKRTLQLGCSGSKSGNVLVSTGDAFVVQCPGAQPLKMAWAKHDQLVGVLPAGGVLQLDDAVPWTRPGTQGNCSVSADAHESLALCVADSDGLHPTRWALAIGLGSDQADAVHHAREWLNQSQPSVDDVITQRLQMYADNSLLSRLPTKYQRLAGKAVSVMRVNALSPEGKIKCALTAVHALPHADC